MPYDLSRLSGLTRAALAIQAVVSALAAFNVHRVGIASQDGLSAGLGLAQASIYVVAAICFLTWTYRAKANANATNAPGISFSPGMAAGSHFIPIINLVTPAQAIQEMYKTSTGIRDWEAVPGLKTIWAWWLIWISGNVAGLISFRLLAMEEAPEAIEFSQGLSIAADLAMVLASLLLFRIVGVIGTLQKRLGDAAQFA